MGSCGMTPCTRCWSTSRQVRHQYDGSVKASMLGQLRLRWKMLWREIVCSSCLTGGVPGPAKRLADCSWTLCARLFACALLGIVRLPVAVDGETERPASGATPAPASPVVARSRGSSVAAVARSDTFGRCPGLVANVLCAPMTPVSINGATYDTLQ